MMKFRFSSIFGYCIFFNFKKMDHFNFCKVLQKKMYFQMYLFKLYFKLPNFYGFLISFHAGMLKNLSRDESITCKWYVGIFLKLPLAFEHFHFRMILKDFSFSRKLLCRVWCMKLGPCMHMKVEALENFLIVFKNSTLQLKL